MTGMISETFFPPHRAISLGNWNASAELATTRPLISVITVVRNSEHQMAKTIKSVADQTYKNVEYVVIDGDSSDGTVQVIKTHEKHINYWISEPDEGIYHAMNKALRVCMGDYFYFLNCGDSFAQPYVLEVVAKRLHADKPDILYGNVLTIYHGRETVVSVKVKSDYDLYQHTICHQATFNARYVFESVGDFDTSYSICADREWLLRALKKHGYILSYVDMPICAFDGAGVSSRQRIRLRIENMKINYRYFGRQFYSFLFKQLENKIRHGLLPIL